jgi:hypothetical protein
MVREYHQGSLNSEGIKIFQIFVIPPTFCRLEQQAVSREEQPCRHDPETSWQLCFSTHDQKNRGAALFLADRELREGRDKAPLGI